MTYRDDRPDLYRTGLSFWSNDDIGPQDIPVIDGKVYPGVYRRLRRRNNSDPFLVSGTGGISTFSQKDPSWRDNKIWVLCSSSPLDPVLKAVNDYGIHWSIQPSKVLTVQEYKAALCTLEADDDPFNFKSHSLESLQDPMELENFDISYNYRQHGTSIRILLEGLCAVAQERIPVDNWDDNDYSHLAILVNSFLAGLIRLNDMVYHPDSLLVKKQAVVGLAIMAYAKVMNKKTFINESEENFWDNDAVVLKITLNMTSFPLLDDSVEF